jgi:hypothetical protein
MENSESLLVFVSYSHADKALKDELSLCLSGLMRQKRISLWIDNCIDPGHEIGAAINSAIEKANIILLLVSPHFIASSYCYEKEMVKALDMHRRGECVVIPIIARPCDWYQLPFGELKALPEDGQAVTTWANRDLAWHDVTQAIRKAIEGRRVKHSSPPVENSSEIRFFLKKAFEELAGRYERGGALDDVHFSMGLSELDYEIGGVGKGALAIITGCRNSGHEDLLLNSLVKNARQGAGVLVLAPRGNGVLIGRRLISLVGSIPLERVSSGDLAEEDWPRITNAIAVTSAFKVHVDDHCGSDFHGLLSRVSDFLSKESISVVYVEGLNRLEVPSGDYRAATRLLKDASVGNSVAVICSLESDTEIGMVANDSLGAWRDLWLEADIITHVRRSSDFYSESNCSVSLLKNFGVVMSREIKLHHDDEIGSFQVLEGYDATSDDEAN